MSTQADLGKKALDAKKYPDAINHLTEALKQSQSPIWLIHRATAYQRSNQYALSLADADSALLIAIGRGRREQMATAHFRRALALHGLKRFGDARMCLNWCNKYNPKEPGLTLWMSLVTKAYEDAGGEEAEENKITVLEVPKKATEAKAEAKAEVKAAVTPAVSTAPRSTPREKIRHEWFQTGKTISIEILAAGVEAKTVEVIFEPRSVEVTFPLEDSHTTFNFTLFPLYSLIVPSECKYHVTPRKIELTLIKENATKWKALEFKEGLNPLEPNAPVLGMPGASSKVDDTGLDSSQKKSVVGKEKEPVSANVSRKEPKNWDSIVADMGDDEDENDPDSFFKKIYKGADDNTKKAMMKSMQESGGTSLSTVWSDVSSKTFTPQPPEGMEAKKY